MKLNEFLKFNNNCPICDEPLSLYMQCDDKTLWKSKKKGNKYTFTPYKLINAPFTADDVMELYDNGEDGVEFKFEGSDIKREYKTWSLNFSYICNRSGINVKGNYAYDINPYYACYVRTTPWMEFKHMPEGKVWELNVINPDHVNLTNLDENFCFKVITNDVEKVYMLNLDYESDKTRLWHYVVTAAQRDDEHYEPKLFSKEMPLVGMRPKFENKTKFIDRMDSWILIS
jgi:hypothetical protein